MPKPPKPPPKASVYTIVDERDKDQFEKRASQLIEDGWEPLGSLESCTPFFRYVQAFVQRRTRPPGVGFKIAFGLPTLKRKKTSMPSEATITNEQKIPVTISPLSEAGKPAKLDGALEWSVISGSGTVADVAADGLSATLVSGDDPGDTDFLIKGDADLGAGIVEVSDTIRLHVEGAQAKNLGITFGTPVAK